MTETARQVAKTVFDLLRAHDLQDGHVPGRVPAQFMAAFEDSGLGLTLVPEEDGGIGLDLGVAATVARSWGHAAAPFPIVEIMLGNLAAAGVDRADLIGRMTLIGRGSSRVGGDIGVAPWWTGVAVAALPCPGGLKLMNVDMVAEHHNYAGEAVLQIALSASDKMETSRWKRPLAAEIPVQGAILSASAILGAMERAIDICLDYVGTRSQFGRPIGKFQAVQHLLADAYAEAALSRTAIARALASELASPASDSHHWLVAKAQASRAADIVASNCHQALGAIGFTEEHHLHRFTKRLLSWRDAWVTATDCEVRLGELACQAGSANLWGMITTGRQLEVTHHAG